MQVGHGHIGNSPLRPFDQAGALSAKIFVEPRIEIFFWLIESIEIKVIQV